MKFTYYWIYLQIMSTIWNSYTTYVWITSNVLISNILIEFRKVNMKLLVVENRSVRSKTNETFVTYTCTPRHSWKSNIILEYSILQFYNVTSYLTAQPFQNYNTISNSTM